MAIAFDATSKGTGTGATVTVAHTCTGSDRGLVVTVRHQGNDISGITYNSTAMTKVGGDREVPDSGGAQVSQWLLLAPSTGTNNIVVSSTGSFSACVVSAISYTGVKQSAQPDGSTTAATGGFPQSSPLSTTITVTASDCWVVTRAVSDYTNLNDSTNFTQRAGATNSGSSPMGDSNGTVGTGSVTIATTWTGNSSACLVAMSLAPAVAAGPTNLKSLDTNVKSNIKSYNTNVIANVKSINTNA